MRSYDVRFTAAGSDEQETFRCVADDEEHAFGQLENVHPGATVLFWDFTEESIWS